MPNRLAHGRPLELSNAEERQAFSWPNFSVPRARSLTGCRLGPHLSRWCRMYHTVSSTTGTPKQYSIAPRHRHNAAPSILQCYLSASALSPGARCTLQSITVSGSTNCGQLEMSHGGDGASNPNGGKTNVDELLRLGTGPSTSCRTSMLRTGLVGKISTARFGYLLPQY